MQLATQKWGTDVPVTLKVNDRSREAIVRKAVCAGLTIKNVGPRNVTYSANARRRRASVPGPGARGDMFRVDHVVRFPCMASLAASARRTLEKRCKRVPCLKTLISASARPHASRAIRITSTVAAVALARRTSDHVDFVASLHCRSVKGRAPGDSFNLRSADHHF